MRYIIILILISLIGCASQEFKSTATPEQKNEFSIVFGQGGGVSGFFTEILVPIGTTKDIDLETVDGENIESPPNVNHREYWLKPGIHKVKVTCRVVLERYITIYGESEITHEFEVGKEYVLDAVIYENSRDTCSPVIRNNYSS